MVRPSLLFTPHRALSSLRLAFAAIFLFSLYWYLHSGNASLTSTYLKGNAGIDDTPATQEDTQSPYSSARHPIDDLIQTAEKNFLSLLRKQSKTIEAAAEAYRARRDRHPPPGFDAWFKFAQERNAVIVEDFFDQIYEDLEPFWALEPAYLRKEAASFEMFISVRNGVATAGSDWFWTKIWLDLLRTIDHLLPDMDIALNPMDEPRMIVPFENMEKYMQTAAKTRFMERPENVMSNYQRLPPKNMVEPMTKLQAKDWKDTKPFWQLARRGCSADSPARKTPLQTSFQTTPTISMGNAGPHLYKGFVANSSLAKDICHQPDLQGLNGIFIEPLSTSTTDTLFPLFGGSKLTVNNEILLPPPMYWNNEERFTGGNNHGGPWAEKQLGVIWRGVATGGRNRESTWKSFHRHRFVSMNNGTELTRVDNGYSPLNFAVPDSIYNIAANAAGKLGQWVESWADVAFTDLMCEPNEGNGHCTYTDPYYSIAPGVALAEQFNLKYLPDIDGNSFSGRYLGFLRSSSLPVKATIWREWHDSRLVAWKHFVPMDSRFGDFYGIMQYFLGYGADAAAHDAQAEQIATAGKDWAEKVLRKEDMQIYTLRLLLEYARVTDGKREKMGWVDDLKRRDDKG
ncbi:hypothetical protein B0T11DRAFT_231209 [Plectosphaerella cucumerina]|uniref:Glycosyl transferase CAP10 domain-containing protein n=1 Tax=Plectosphaerella cucumerina TaxID=40658 RepID=A0A8K0TDR6_9PEZI|nr:hypothetical protein B0T11DRAFT_231209 [Plectosphaerella cucumerina]